MKRIGKIKRVGTLGLIFLLSINNFATSVANNDGSAFITKAEFDALKSSFQAQIDTYNTNIDSKIDAAITSYLKGISIKKEDQYKLPLADWKKVTALNGKVDPIFQYPSVNLSKTRMNWNRDTSGWRRHGYTFVNLKYTQSTTAKSTRPCVDGMKEDFTSITRMYWIGQYKNWQETIQSIIEKRYSTDLYAIEIGGIDNRFYLYQPNYFEPLAGGYQSDLNSVAQNVWKAGFSYYSSYSGRGFENFESNALETSSNVLALTIKAEKDNDNYEHIIEYHNCGDWEVYNSNFSKTFRKSKIDTKKTKDWWVAAGWNISKQWEEMKYRRDGSNFSYPTLIHNGNVTLTEKNWNASSDTNKEIPRIGLVKSEVYAKDIKQAKEVVQVSKKGILQSAEDVNLVNGFVLLYGEKDEKITWQPKFINLLSPDGIISGTTEVEMQLSMVPFSDDVTVLDTSDKIRVNAIYSGTSSIKDTTTPYTSGRTVKLEWKMPKDGFVYIKWYPKLTNPDYLINKQWEIDLDLENCDVYKSKLE